MLWSKTSVVHKPPTNNTTDRTSERLTLQQQLKPFSAKHTRNGSRSPSREQSTTKSNDQPKDQEIAKLIPQTEKLKQVNQKGNITWSYSSGCTKNSNWTKSPTKFKKRTNGLQNRRPNKNNRNAKCNFIHLRHNENFVKLRRKTEETIRYKSDPEGTESNLAAFFFSKKEYKILNKNSNFIPTSKVYNKNELDNDLNNFFALKKLKTHFKDSINKDIDDENRIFQPNKNKGWAPDKNHYSIDTFVKAVKKDIECTKTFRLKQPHPNLDKSEKGIKKIKELSKREDIIMTNADKGGAVVIVDLSDYIKEAITITYYLKIQR